MQIGDETKVFCQNKKEPLVSFPSVSGSDSESIPTVYLMNHPFDSDSGPDTDSVYVLL